MPLHRSVVSMLLGAMLLASAQAMDASDAGTYVAVDPEGAPIGKVLRVSRQGVRWRFEDRQPDGSWVDVSCQGGCDHQPASEADIVRIFGSPPPPHLRPDCIFNQQYAFCRIHAVGAGVPDRHTLMVKIEDRWMAVSLTRLPSDMPQQTPPATTLESARWH